MSRHRLQSGLSVVLAGVTLVMTGLGVRYNLLLLFVASVFGVAAVLVGSRPGGRLSRLGRRLGGLGRRDPSGTARRVGPTRFADRTGGRDPRRRRGSGGSAGGTGTDDGHARETVAAYRTLGLDPGASEASVRRAYRERVKETHPDLATGDEARFKELTAAYERLTD